MGDLQGIVERAWRRSAPEALTLGDLLSEACPDHLRWATVALCPDRTCGDLLATVARLTALSENKSNFRSSIRSAVRALWSGVWDYYQFFDDMLLVVDNGYTRAWYEGAQECGIQPAELTPEERTRLRQAIVGGQQHIDGFATEIEANSKEEGGKLTPLLVRADLWVNQYDSVRLQAQSIACGDRKYRWVLGANEQHCRSCSALDGKVKRMSFWRDYALPRNAPNPRLECGGWRCRCDLVATDEHMTRGRMPNLP